jgi:hypothetical protein
MSELPEDDPRVQQYLQMLMDLLADCVGTPLTTASITVMREVIDDARTEFKQKFGHELPPLVPLVLPLSRFIAWFRQDLDSDEVRIKVLNLLREFYVKRIPVSAFELARAMKLTWPSYEPPIEFYRNSRQVRLLQ